MRLSICFVVAKCCSYHYDLILCFAYEQLYYINVLGTYYLLH